MVKERWFRFGIGFIMLFVIIWLIHSDSYVFTPFIIFAKTLFIPFLIAGLLFYLTRPLVEFLEKARMPRKLAILLIFLIIIGILVLIVNLLAPVVQEQFNRLIDNIPAMRNTIENGIEFYKQNQSQIPTFVVNAVSDAVNQLQGTFTSAGSSIGSLLGGLFDFLFSLVVIPFILFYLLDDRNKFSKSVMRFFPRSQQKEIGSVLKDMDSALGNYIQGQLIVSTCVGVLLLIGYLIIGLNYALLLALFGMVTTVIPFLGAIIAVIPAIIAAFIQDPIMALYVVIVMLGAHQIESNLISPQVMGRALKAHPLTIILLILVGGNLAGILGMILIIPTYAVLKVIVQHVVKLVRIRRQEAANILKK
ncbi:MAG TPA: AI-2E family transporter [Bacillales bacterium]|nr:AI-2E family transporter [Bacillales bacterium]